MQPPWDRQDQGLLSSSVPAQLSIDSTGRAEPSHVATHHPQSATQLQVDSTPRVQPKQASGSKSRDASSSSSTSSLGQDLRSPLSSADMIVAEGSASKAGRTRLSRSPEVTSPSNLRPQSAGFNRRKIFGRSASIRDVLGGRDTSDTLAHSAANRNSNGLHPVLSSPASASTPSTKEPGFGFLRHMGSKSFLNLNDSKGMSSSTEHLPINPTELQGSKRLSDSLKIFGRRRDSSVSKGSDTSKGDTVSEFGQASKNHREMNFAGIARLSGDSLGSVSSSERKQRPSHVQSGHMSSLNAPEDSAAGFPKRLGGWLQNIIGNDSTASNSDGTNSPSAKEPVTSEKAVTLLASSNKDELHGRETLSGPVATASTAENSQATSDLLTSTKSSVGSRAGALLQTLTSAPVKVVKSGTTSSPNASAWASGSVGIDRAFRFFLDNDTESKSEEGIWLLGVWHGPSPDSDAAELEDASKSIAQASPPSSQPIKSEFNGEESGPADIARQSQQSSQLERVFPPADTVSSIDRSRLPSPASSLSRANSSSSAAVPDWQATFQSDFSSRVWSTYRNHFAPITRDGTISDEAASAAEIVAAAAAHPELTSSNEVPSNRIWLGRKATESVSATDQPAVPSTVSPIGLGAALGAGYATATTSLGDKMGISNLWGRATAAAQAAGFSRGLTTDAGWGCMLRTGQSLLANALMDVHLGRSWHRGPPPLRQYQLFEQLSSSQADQGTDHVTLATWRQKRRQYAVYVRILSWFLDDASPASPFSIHRMAREGKRLGKEVGEWFGPSTAAGAIKQLVSDFGEAGLGVVLDHDGVFHLNEVRATSVQQADSSLRRKTDAMWQRPVLILIGIRLGLESVNPIYYDSVKATFSFPQSVGIAGGRPSSSYYFMGHQGNSLFYLDPHNVRPAVPLRFPPKKYPAAVPEHADVTCRCGLDPKDGEDEWWAHAYSEAQTSTFHCDKVRRMPIKSLDPSMLLGFLVKDEKSLLDLCARIKALPKTILSFADSAPTWIDDDDFDPSMESFSESSAGGDTDDGRHQVTRSDAEADTDILTTSQTIDRRLAGAPTPRAPIMSPSELDSSTIARQRTAEWLGQSHASPVSGIAFPSFDVQDSRPSRQSPRTDMRLVSSSSNVTARPDNNDHQLRNPRSVVGRTKALISASSVTEGAAKMDDDSFSSMHLSGSEVDSGWEEVSEVGTVAPSASAAAVARLVLGENPSSHTIPEPKDDTASDALGDSVLVERPSRTRRATDSSDLMADMVAVSLDTPVSEAPQLCAKMSDRARISMELGSSGTHSSAARDKSTSRSPPSDKTGGYFELT